MPKVNKSKKRNQKRIVNNKGPLRQEVGFSNDIADIGSPTVAYSADSESASSSIEQSSMCSTAHEHESTAALPRRTKNHPAHTAKPKGMNFKRRRSTKQRPNWSDDDEEEDQKQAAKTLQDFIRLFEPDRSWRKKNGNNMGCYPSTSKAMLRELRQSQKRRAREALMSKKSSISNAKRKLRSQTAGPPQAVVVEPVSKVTKQKTGKGQRRSRKQKPNPVPVPESDSMAMAKKLKASAGLSKCPSPSSREPKCRSPSAGDMKCASPSAGDTKYPRSTARETKCPSPSAGAIIGEHGETVPEPDAHDAHHNPPNHTTDKDETGSSDVDSITFPNVVVTVIDCQLHPDSYQCIPAKIVDPKSDVFVSSSDTDTVPPVPSMEVAVESGVSPSSQTEIGPVPLDPSDTNEEVEVVVSTVSFLSPQKRSHRKRAFASPSDQSDQAPRPTKLTRFSRQRAAPESSNHTVSKRNTLKPNRDRAQTPVTKAEDEKTVRDQSLSLVLQRLSNFDVPMTLTEEGEAPVEKLPVPIPVRCSTRYRRVLKYGSDWV